MELSGEININMRIGEAKDLEMELDGIIYFVAKYNIENKENQLSMNTVCEVFSKIRSITSQGEEHKTWEMYKIVNQEK